MTTQILGTVASEIAYTIFAPWRMIPPSPKPNSHVRRARMLNHSSDVRVSARPDSGGERVYRAILRATTVLILLLASVVSARANALVFVDVPARNATVPTSFIVGG